MWVSDGYCYNTVYYSRYTITQSVHLGSDGFPTIIQSVDRRRGQRAPLLSPTGAEAGAGPSGSQGHGHGGGMAGDGAALPPGRHPKHGDG